MIKKFIILIFVFIPIKALALIEVDITRGNLNPLPLAVSPLSIDETSRKNFEQILDHARMNKPGQGFYKVLAESALRAVRLCQPLRVPSSGYERWKELQLNFDAREMLGG